MANEAAQALLTGLQQKLGILQQGSKTKTYLRTKMGDDISRAIENIGIDVSKLLTERKAEKERKEVARNQQIAKDFLVGGGSLEGMKDLKFSEETPSGKTSAASLVMQLMGDLRNQEVADLNKTILQRKVDETDPEFLTALNTNATRVVDQVNLWRESGMDLSTGWARDTDPKAVGLLGDPAFVSSIPEKIRPRVLAEARGMLGVASPEETRLRNLQIQKVEAELNALTTKKPMTGADDARRREQLADSVLNDINTAYGDSEMDYLEFAESFVSSIPKTAVPGDVLERVREKAYARAKARDDIQTVETRREQARVDLQRAEGAREAGIAWTPLLGVISDYAATRRTNLDSFGTMAERASALNMVKGVIDSYINENYGDRDPSFKKALAIQLYDKADYTLPTPDRLTPKDIEKTAQDLYESSLDLYSGATAPAWGTLPDENKQVYRDRVLQTLAANRRMTMLRQEDTAVPGPIGVKGRRNMTSQERADAANATNAALQKLMETFLQGQNQ